jgi:DNA-binding beta-propeller fold protein YncE
VGSSPYGIFITTNNSIYVACRNLSKVEVWTEGSDSPTKTISGGLNEPHSLFVMGNGDIYVDNGYVNHRLDKWAWNAITSIPVINITGRCHSMFIDIYNTLYCSLDEEHKVVKTSLNNVLSAVETVAGNGTEGSQSPMLAYPNGLFVDIGLNLYVADCRNNRVLIFQFEQLNGTTVVGNETAGAITLYCPNGIILDADGYLFITDHDNHRIVRFGPIGFQCLFGCSRVSGSESDQLNRPRGISFDSYGNIFIVDKDNDRIQKLVLATNSCGEYNHI